MSQPSLPKIDPGKRAIVAGRTGSGKTVLAGWLMQRSPQKWIILNPKHTAGYDTLPNATVLDGFKAKNLDKSLDDSKYLVLNFAPNESTPQFMDAVIGWLHNQYGNIGLCVDELYAIHDGVRPLPGLTAWLTRGRERKQSFIGLMQRPAWVSRFCFSESDFIGGMALTLEDDRKRMRANTGRDDFLKMLDAHYWLWYRVGADELGLYGPVPLPSPQEN